MGVTINIERGIERIPANYFPIVSLEDFVEKVSDLLKGSRLPRLMRSKLKKFARQMPKFDYPIADSVALERHLSAAPAIRLRGKHVEPHKTVSSLPKRFFPITSKKDFAFKVAALAGARALQGSR
jgi:hypothetical protein